MKEIIVPIVLVWMILVSIVSAVFTLIWTINNHPVIALVVFGVPITIICIDELCDLIRWVMRK